MDTKGPIFSASDLSLCNLEIAEVPKYIEIVSSKKLEGKVN